MEEKCTWCEPRGKPSVPGRVKWRGPAKDAERAVWGEEEFLLRSYRD